MHHSSPGRLSAGSKDGIPAELKMMLLKCCQQIWKTQQWPQDWKRSVFIPTPKKGNAKECSKYCTSAIISHDSKIMLRTLHARLQLYMNRELPDVQAEFITTEEPEIKLPTSVES